MHNSSYIGWKLLLIILYINIILTENRSISKDYIESDYLSSFSFVPDSYFTKFIRKRHIPQPIKRNRCEIKIVADYDFFQVIGNENYANTARYLINLIERVNAIFTKVDWGLEHDGNRLVNLGFSIKNIKIYDDINNTKNNPKYFNAYFKNDNQVRVYNAGEILKSFSILEGTNDTCLTILITAKVFDHGILGMANIGNSGERGICATKPINDTYANTAVITVRRVNELMITRVVDLVAAHELGHAWGSHHDEESDPECLALNPQEGKFIMYESSNTGYDKNNYFFSPCSINSIQKVLYPIASNCFVEEKDAFCGNGILENGEDCDIGGHLSSNATDPCCTKECKFREHAVCSPRHSECCSDKCQYLDSFNLCQPKNDENCKQEAYCSGNSSKCPDPKPIYDGVQCAEEGTCKSGQCINFCTNLSPILTPCLCENVTSACLRCCRSTITGLCEPVKPEKPLIEGSICFEGQCHNRLCEKKLTDETSLFIKFIRNIKETPQRKFLADYIVFIIVFVTLLFWIPGVYYINYRVISLFNSNMV